MPQGDLVVANQSGAAFRSDVNAQLLALGTLQSGATAPTPTTYAYQWWANTTDGLLYIRNGSNSAWIVVGTLADTNLGLLSLAGGTLTGALLADDSGTAALPAIAFDGDPNTGIFRAGADQFGIATNGVERVEFGTTEVVFNDGGADVDFRIEGDTEPNLFKIDAGLDEVQVANLNGGQLAGTRNRIINGDMRIDQRNNGGSVSSGLNTITYTVDRWSVAASGAAVSAQRQGTAGVLLWINVTGAAGNTVTNIRQRIEASNIGDLANRTVTLSFFCSSTTATSVSAIVACASAFDNFTSVTNAQTFVPTITSTGTLYSTTFTLPPQAANGVEVMFSLSNFTSGTFALTEVQLELSPVATPFERRSIGAELALCKRYAQWVPFSQQFYAPGAVTHESTLSWPEMRANPNAAALTADPNSVGGSIFLNNAQNFIRGVTPYGGSAVLIASTAGSSYAIGYRSFLSAEL
jgi:hypothetical protein